MCELKKRPGTKLIPYQMQEPVVRLSRERYTSKLQLHRCNIIEVQYSRNMGEPGGIMVITQGSKT